LACACAAGNATTTSSPAKAPPIDGARALQQTTPAATPTAIPPTPPVASATETDSNLELGGRLAAMEDEYRHPPREVTDELEWTAKEYPELPALRRLPDFLSVDALVALAPASERGFVRERLHAQLDGTEQGALLGTFVDDEERLLVLWIAGNLTQVLAVFDGSRLAARRVIERGTPRLGEVLGEQDGTRAEILVERIDSMSVCCHPLALDVLRVGPHGALREVLTFPRGHADVGPGVLWSFLNHFDFQDDRVVITHAFPADGTRYELVFKPQSGRYEPTPATAKLLAAERRAEAEQAAP